jgi:hypothetical protein
MRTTAAMLVAAMVLGGCAATYHQDTVTAPTAQVQRGRAVVVATPTNGSYERREYFGSGRQTAVAIQAAFARFGDAVVSSRCADLACLQAEADSGVSYLVVPQILHWEDRNTEWSGKPDRIEIKIIVVDAQSRKTLASVVISGKSKWATFGGDRPQDLLPEPVGQFVQSLYR